MALTERLLRELATGALLGDQANNARSVLEFLDRHGYLDQIVEHASGISELKLIELCAKVCEQAIDVQVTLDRQQTGTHSQDSLKRAIRGLCSERSVVSEMIQHRGLGGISHQAAVALLAHRPISKPGRKRISASATSAISRLVDCDNPILTKQGELRQVHIHSLERELKRWLETNNSHRKAALRRLAATLSPLVGSHQVERVLLARLPDEALRGMVLGSWAQLAQYTAGAAPVFIDELPFWRDYWFSGGRMDALMIVDTDGHQLTGKLRKKAAEAVALRPRNLIELIGLLPDIGYEMSLEVIDFKFQVGDAVNPFSVLRADEVATKPIPKHFHQVRRYLAKSNIAFRKDRDLNRTPWDEPVIRCAQLWYVFPDQPVKVHYVTATADERREIITELRENKQELLEAAKIHRRSVQLIHQLKRAAPSSQLVFDL